MKKIADVAARRYFLDEPDLSPFLTALHDVRQRATREGYCYQHVQAIKTAIDDFAECEMGHREFFWNKPHKAG